MEAIINKIQLKKILNRYYLKIVLIDLDGNIRKVDTPLNSVISFRKQIFGILSACGTFDLMKLATENPIPKKVIGYYTYKLQILENDKNEWLIYDKDRVEYTCKKVNKKQKKMMDTLIKSNLSSISKEEGRIERIISQSGVFQLLFNSRGGITSFTTGQIYYGFGYPLDIGNEENTDEVEKSAKLFTSFIISLVKFYGINDLLDFGKNKDNPPLVEITINKNNEITSIVNPNTGIGLSVDEKYDVINVFKLEKTNK